MLVVNNMTELFDPIHMVSKVSDTAFVKEHNIKIRNFGHEMNFIELENYTCYTFKHSSNGDLIKIIHELFKIDDVDLVLYLIIHTYNKAISNGEDGFTAVVTYPLYSDFVNTKHSELEIGKWHNVPIFSPFVKEKPQNLFTKITPNKLVKAILAGQIEKVICNGNYTDDYYRNEENNYWRGEWDILDFAEKIYGHDTKFYGISRHENTICVFSYAGEWHEDYTVYIKNGY